jgi:hypothetical protein
MRKLTKIITAAAFAGLAVTAGSALTGTGVTNNASASQFIGGTVSQSVTGATLTNIAYQYVDGSNTAVNSITLTFGSGLDTKVPTAVLSGGTGTTFTCAAVAAAGTTSLRSPVGAPMSYTGLASLAVTIS